MLRPSIVVGTAGLGLVAARVAAGLTTGSLAITAAQPMDVVKIRLQAGAGHPYSGLWHAYTSIVAREGVRAGLYRGLAPNIGRNAIVNVAETVVYDTVKQANSNVQTNKCWTRV